MFSHAHEKTHNIFKAPQHTMQARTDKTGLNIVQSYVW